MKRFIAHQGGATMIEFALAAPLLLTLTFGVFEIGRLYYIRSNLDRALYEGSRYAMVHPFASNSTISQQVTQYITAVNAAEVSISVQDTTINSKPFKQMSLSYSFTSLASSLINLISVPVSMTVSVPILQ